VIGNSYIRPAISFHVTFKILSSVCFSFEITSGRRLLFSVIKYALLSLRSHAYGSSQIKDVINISDKSASTMGRNSPYRILKTYSLTSRTLKEIVIGRVI
jgi:hypothetical protein